MSAPGTRRLFIAVPLAEAARAAVESVVAQVRAAEREAARDAPGVRWVRVEGLHLTLKFLGSTPDARRPSIEAGLDAAALGMAPFRVRISGAGAFPSPNRPRALWLGIEEGGAALADLARRVDDRLAEAGWEREGRPFRAHLTLARSDGVPTAAQTVQLLAAAARDLDAEWMADHVTLYESQLGGGPARYVALHESRFEGG